MFYDHQVDRICQTIFLKMETMFSKITFMLTNMKSIGGRQDESYVCQNSFYVCKSSINTTADNIHFLNNEILCWTGRSRSGGGPGLGQELQCCWNQQSHEAVGGIIFT